MALVLKELRAIHEKAHGTAATDAEMPALDSVGMHNLAKSTGTTDNAANAQKCVRVECQALVTTAVKEHMGEEKFDALSEAERTLATKLYGRHLANTWIDGGAKSEMAMLDELIPAEHVALARFCDAPPMSTNSSTHTVKDWVKGRTGTAKDSARRSAPCSRNTAARSST